MLVKRICCKQTIKRNINIPLSKYPVTYPDIYWPIFYIWQRQFIDNQTTLYTLSISQSHRR